MSYFLILTNVSIFLFVLTITDWFPAIAILGIIFWHWNKASDRKDFNPSTSSRHLHKVSQYCSTILSSLFCRYTLWCHRIWHSYIILSLKHALWEKWFALSAFCVTLRNYCATLHCWIQFNAFWYCNISNQRIVFTKLGTSPTCPNKFFINEHITLKLIIAIRRNLMLLQQLHKTTKAPTASSYQRSRRGIRKRL